MRFSFLIVAVGLLAIVPPASAQTQAIDDATRFVMCSQQLVSDVQNLVNGWTSGIYGGVKCNLRPWCYVHTYVAPRFSCGIGIVGACSTAAWTDGYVGCYAAPYVPAFGYVWLWSGWVGLGDWGCDAVVSGGLVGSHCIRV